MKLVIIIMTMITSLTAAATVTVAGVNCPVQFEGRVAEVIEPVGAVEAMSMNSIVMENRHTIKGEVEDKVTFEILQNGPFKIQVDREYRVQLRNGKVCWIEEI